MEVPTRAEFLFQGPWQKALFYAILAVSLGIFAWQVWGRVRLWRQGKPISWRPDYLGGVVKFVLGQRKVRTSRPKSGAPMHLMIFYGFLALFIATTLLGINTYSPWKFHKGTYYLAYEFVFDIMGVVLFVGLVWALLRRRFAKPKALTSAPADFSALYMLLILTVSGFLVEGARMNVNPKSFDTSAPVGYLVSGVLPQLLPAHYLGIWWTHAVLVAVFIAIIPRLRIRHIAYAIFSAAGHQVDRKMGALKPITMQEVEEAGQIGVKEPKDYSRWHLLSLDACMECGRCTEVCPAWLVGKVLNPKEVVQNIRGAMKNGTTVAAAVTEEALWQCTTCNACVEACPVLINQVDLITDARRYLVAEGRAPGTSGTMLRQVASTESAWGTPSGDREKWMAGQDVPLVRDLVANGEKFEVLLWVGCAGSVDRGAMKTTRDFAALLKKANVSFACLGKEEKCTGDPARRTGDEFLFQQMAEQNVATLEQYGVKTVVTACPHCFNTIKNEYSVFGGDYEVLHHSQFLSTLIKDGKLNAPSLEDGAVTLHDPCYLARINNEADAPRHALGVPSNLNDHRTPVDRWLNEATEDGNRLAEPQRRAQKTLCCGAGGGRMWIEEDINQRPGDNRARELIGTGAKTVATACPFCRIMLDASLNNVAPDQGINLVDIVELVKQAND
ncbi:MAG: 4Fe-4S dicluster domain-containing protein [Armatimonadetes bacterium]|nr:4Fe-4S dicluster domain-containing protein [Armatimonadota bacterium]